MKNGQWNTFRVVAEGPRFRTWINGHAVEDVTDEQSPKCGMICLQVHGVGRGQGPYEVRWRNIKLRKISGGAASE